MKKISCCIGLVLIINTIVSAQNPPAAKTQATDSLAAVNYFTFKGINVDSCVNKLLYFEIYKWLDTPYRYGGETGKGIDCSGFSDKIYRAVYGITLEGGSRDIFQHAKPVKIKLAEEGDLLFFKIRKGQISHVGIYLQNGKFAHATTQAGVIISDLSEPYYKKYFFKAGKFKKPD